MLAPVDVTDIKIETERLVLRAWRESDLDDLYAYARVDGVGQMAGWLPHRSIEESRRILRFFIDEKKTFAIQLKETGHVIGSIGLEEFEPRDIHKTDKLGREIGYVLSKEFWGRGLIPEAVDAVIDYCFAVLDFDYVTCEHFVQNTQSRRVIEKLDFSFVEEGKVETRYETTEITRYYVKYNPAKGR